MLSTSRRLAASVSKAPLKLEEASAQLLPPIALYRRLLRVHRKLPDEMRYLGDSYVKSEFHRTRKTDNPLHIIGFLSQWKLYLDEVQQSVLQPGEPFKGRQIKEDLFEKLSDEQAGQLYEFMHATKDIWKSPEELEAQAQASETGATSTDPLQRLQDAHVKLHSGSGDADGVNPSVEQQDQVERDPLKQLQDAHEKLHSGSGDADGFNPSVEQQDQVQRASEQGVDGKKGQS